MLLRDGRVARAPAVAEQAQVGQDGLAEHRLDAEVAHQAVERGLRAGVVEGVERRPQLGRTVARPAVRRGRRAARCEARAASAADSPSPRCACIARTRALSRSE